MTNVAIVLQARMGSARLPGKSLASIQGLPMLAHCVSRLQQSGAGQVVVATSTGSEDDPLAATAARLGAIVHRGSPDDVLARVTDALALVRTDLVVRATGDNPAVDPDSVTRLLAVARGTRCDHAVEDGLPIGATVEIMTTLALRQAAACARAPYDREHVTPYIRATGNGFLCAVVPAPKHLARPDLRFTVDTPGDLDYMRRVFEAAGPEGPHSLERLISAADALDRSDRQEASVA